MTWWINALPASWLTFGHLSLVFGLTKPTVLEKNALVSTAALFTSGYQCIALPANMKEVVKMMRARKTLATSGNANRLL